MHGMLANDQPKPASLAGGLPATRIAFEDLRAKRTRWLAPLPVVSSKRFWATQRRRLSKAAQYGMRIVIISAAVNILLLTPTDPDVARASIATSFAIAVCAILASAMIARQWRKSPLLPLLAVLTLVDLGSVGLALAYPEMHPISFGYLILLPAVVALAIPWSARVHGTWLLMHLAIAVAYLVTAQLLARFEVRAELALLAVSSVASLYGQFSGYHARIDSFLNIQRINALNRQARRDQLKLAALNQILDQTARTDALTGLKNRLSLERDLVALRSRVARRGERYILILADLDHFKGVNDHFGHVAGDAVLRTVADGLAVSFRPEDGIYRFGGEEFALLIRSTRGTDANVVAERVRQSVRSLDLAHPGNPPHHRVTISVGSFAIGKSGLALDDDDWFRRADEALYRAKAQGRNRSAVWVRTAPVAAQARPSRKPASITST